jgi:hypothetical protein
MERYCKTCLVRDNNYVLLKGFWEIIKHILTVHVI